MFAYRAYANRVVNLLHAQTTNLICNMFVDLVTARCESEEKKRRKYDALIYLSGMSSFR